MSNILVIFTEFPMYKMRVGNLAHYFLNLKSLRDVNGDSRKSRPFLGVSFQETPIPRQGVLTNNGWQKTTLSTYFLRKKGI